MLERPACVLCGTDERNVLMDGFADDLAIVECVTCGLVYTHPRLTPEEVARQVYDTDWYRQLQLDSDPGWKGAADQADRLLAVMSRHGLPREAAILEVGPGLGGFLRRAKEHGHEVYGVESSRYAVERIAELQAITVERAPAEQLRELDLPTLDAVVMLATVEHLHEPLAVLEAIRARLEPGGLLVVSTGVWGSPNQRLAGRRWQIIDPRGHLYYFSKQTLRQALEVTGFKQLDLHTNGSLVNPATDWWLLVKLFNNPLAVRSGLPWLTARLRLGDEMFVTAKAVM